MARSRRIPEVPPSPQSGPAGQTFLAPFEKFRVGPGTAPYRLDLAQVLGPAAVAEIEAAGVLAFHVLGDTGGIKSPEPQQIVAIHLANDLAKTEPPARPSFLYHLGDVVYYYGERADYYDQFYEPYIGYWAAIMAIPGNHDGERLDKTSEPSLAAFADAFCAPRPRHQIEAHEVPRDAMVQPNVYWTLVTPLATIVGLYTNVPEYGVVKPAQSRWFVQELSKAPKDRALIVALHHPPYSVDQHHGASAAMDELLTTSFTKAGRAADLVLSGHVHNYQRFTRQLGDRQLPYIVAGAGGYWHLHDLAANPDGTALPIPRPIETPGVTLEAATADRHGFLRLTVTKTTVKGVYTTVPRPTESWHSGPVAHPDTFTLDLEAHTVSSP